jgi:hypothetical protein
MRASSSASAHCTMECNRGAINQSIGITRADTQPDRTGRAPPLAQPGHNTRQNAHGTDCTQSKPCTQPARQDAGAHQGQGPERKESGAPREDRHGAPISSTCRREQHRQRKNTVTARHLTSTPPLAPTRNAHLRHHASSILEPGLSTYRCVSWRAISNAAHRPHKHASTAATHRQAPH